MPGPGREAQMEHAIRRAQERYGWTLSVDELEALNKQYNSKALEPLGVSDGRPHRRILCLVRVEPHVCLAVYDWRQKTIVTFLPEHDRDAVLELVNQRRRSRDARTPGELKRPSWMEQEQWESQRMKQNLDVIEMPVTDVTKRAPEKKYRLVTERSDEYKSARVRLTNSSVTLMLPASMSEDKATRYHKIAAAMLLEVLEIGQLPGVIWGRFDDTRLEIVMKHRGQRVLTYRYLPEVPKPAEPKQGRTSDRLLELVPGGVK
jgi:hypothetical protein